ncbi:MAG: alkaline phosphatase D family protein [Pseudomonadota bacterium]
MTTVTRRGALLSALAGGACAGAPKLTAYSAATEAKTGTFAHGVASGDPKQDSVVIWTRVTPTEAVALPVRYEIANDKDFSSIIRSERTTAQPAGDWTVKIVVENLDPGRTYYYRFFQGDAVSDVGRTRTLPSGATESARFAVVSCSNYPFGYFNVYDLIARTPEIDAVIHLGDYIYEYGPDGYGGSVGAEIGRPHEPAREITTLSDYRRRHAQYKSDPSAQAMHALHPIIAIWDDHETTNNSWKDGAENHQPTEEGDWESRKRAALQAYYEWMPVREPAPGMGPEAFFRDFSFGDLLTLTSIETRLMARAKQIEYSEVVPKLKTPEDIERFRNETLYDQSREMLGEAQLDFIDRSLRESKAKGQPWRLLANQIIMAEVISPDLTPHVTEEDLQTLESQWSEVRAFVEFSKLGLPSNLDAWDGYPAARERLYERIREAQSDGLVVLTGDTHTWWANDLLARNGDHMGVELGVISVTSPSPYADSFLGGKGADYALLTNRDNPSVRYLSGSNHGYIDLEVTPERIEARFMAVDRIDSPSYNGFEKAGFTITQKKNSPKFAGISGVGLKERFLF